MVLSNDEPRDIGGIIDDEEEERSVDGGSLDALGAGRLDDTSLRIGEIDGVREAPRPRWRDELALAMEPTYNDNDDDGRVYGCDTVDNDDSDDSGNDDDTEDDDDEIDVTLIPFR